MRRIILTLAFFVSALSILSQVQKPTFMVVPSKLWCVENGYAQKIDVNGRTKTICDYEKAIKEDEVLKEMLAKVGNILTESGLEVKDLAAELQKIAQQEGETPADSTQMALPKASVSVMSSAKPDILVNMYWKIDKLPTGRSVTLSMDAVDTKNSKRVASVQHVGLPARTSYTNSLVKQAIYENIDQFLFQLARYLDDIALNGRQ